MPGVGRFFFARFPLLLGALLAGSLPLLAGCGDDDNPPPGDKPAGRVVVTSAAELDSALTHAVSGDTIEIDGGFSGPTFTMDQGYDFAADKSPLFIRAASRTTIRPEIVFPSNVNGFVFHDHSGTVLKNLSIRGGLNAILLDNSDVDIDTLVIRNPATDAVLTFGSGCTGRVRGCFFDTPGRFGVSTNFGITSKGKPNLMIEKNTIVMAGECGLYIGSNDSIHNNNVYKAHVFGMIFDGNSTSPDVGCNNCYLSGTRDYEPFNDIGVPGDDNYSVDPKFCSGSYNLKDISPLAPVNSGVCGLIGALPVEEGCTAATE